ncbi:MAG: hypothetical protein BWK80_30370 [Desulfobacteraceae bacterium IS3]|nr:MAG: hypothetical protein BWK80_30370 [Desulfobacteraceae bacterium IS3]
MQLQERVFEKLFKLAEIEKFGYKERMVYEDSLKVYRDLKNSLDTAREEGREKGREEGRAEGEKVGIEKGEKRRRQRLQKTFFLWVS